MDKSKLLQSAKEYLVRWKTVNKWKSENISSRKRGNLPRKFVKFWISPMWSAQECESYVIVIESSRRARFCREHRKTSILLDVSGEVSAKSQGLIRAGNILSHAASSKSWKNRDFRSKTQNQQSSRQNFLLSLSLLSSISSKWHIQFSHWHNRAMTKMLKIRSTRIHS